MCVLNKSNFQRWFSLRTDSEARQKPDRIQVEANIQSKQNLNRFEQVGFVAVQIQLDFLIQLDTIKCEA